jgi:hypothetical protein
VQAWANEGFAKWMRRLHPLRLQYEMFSHANPFMSPLIGAVANAQANRRPVASDNVFWRAQEQLAQYIEQTLDAYRDVRDHMAEAWFHAIYGSPLLQAMLGLRASDASVRRRPGKDPAHAAAVARRIQELKADIAKGGPREAVLRALLYIRMPEGAVDERGFNLLHRAREEAGEGLTLGEFKRLVREQFLMLLLDNDRAVEAIPRMLAQDHELASRMAVNLRRIIDVVGLRSSLAKARLAEIEEIIEGSTGTRHAKRAVTRVSATSPQH